MKFGTYGTLVLTCWFRIWSLYLEFWR